MKCVLMYLLVLCLHLSASGQLIKDPIIDLDIHYGSDNIGPQIYLYMGDKLRLEYSPHVGIMSIFLAQQTSSNNFKPVITPLAEELQGKWSREYVADAQGCYTILFKPGGRGFVDSNLRVARIPGEGNQLLPTTCINHASEPTIDVGEERYLSKSEVGALSKKNLPVTVKKEVHEEGGDYCEITFTLKREQSAVIHLNPTADENVYTHVNLYREISEELRVSILNDFQAEINDFGFQSLYGGTYTIHFWGENIYNRTNCITVQVSN